MCQLTPELTGAADDARCETEEGVIFMTAIYLLAIGIFNLIVWLNLT